LDSNVELQRASFPLSFRLGEIKLASPSLDVAEVVAHFLENPVRLPEVLRTNPATVQRRLLLARSLPLDEALPEQSLAGDRVVYRLNQYRRFFVDLRGTTFEQYLARFSSKSRSTLQRKLRKFEAKSGGTMDWVTCRSIGDLDSFLDEALALSQLTYQHRLLHSGIPGDALFREHMRALCGENRFRGWLLRQSGRPVAYICSPVLGKTVLYEYVGFDPAFGDQSPGTVLQALVLQQLMGEGEFDYFDFTEGEGPHKEFFASGGILCADVLVVPNEWKFRTLLGAHRAFVRSVQAATRFLHRMGVKDRLKRLLRRAA